MWGEIDAAGDAEEIIRRSRSLEEELLQAPLGKSLVAELARLYNAFATGSALESIALMATIVLPILALQKPHYKSKVKEHVACLERRIKAWKVGNLAILLTEGRTLQQRLPKVFTKQKEENLSRSFANLMFKGKTHAAQDLLTKDGRRGLLHIVDAELPNSESCPQVKPPRWTTCNNNFHSAGGTARHPSCCFRQY